MLLQSLLNDLPFVILQLLFQGKILGRLCVQKCIIKLLNCWISRGRIISTEMLFVGTMITSRSTKFSNSRTFPGQLYCCMNCNA